MIKKILRNCLVVALLFLTKNVNATAYYISTTGSDGASGLVGFPKATLASIFSTYNLASGDVINVAAGTYTEKGITVGTDDEGFTILGATMSTTIFDSDQTEFWLRAANANNDNISFQNLTIKDYKRSAFGDGGGVYLLNGCSTISFTSVTFNNCDTWSTAYYGGAIYMDGNTGVTITSCVFTACDGANFGSAVSNYNSTGACSLTVSKSIFYSNNATYGSCIAFDGATSTISITNSLFYGNTNANGGAIDFTDVGTTTVTNCTVAGNSNNQIVSWVAGTYTFKNVIAYGNNADYDFYENAGTMNLTNCSYGAAGDLGSISGSNTAGVTGNPLFTNSGSSDYTLTSSSPCKNAGTSTGAPADDLAGITRDASPDIGCYEAADYYWVGGTGNWSDYAAHWATTSGGSTFWTSAPTSSNNVIFDALSGGGTCTINATANAGSITCTGYTGTWSGSSALNCYGSLLLVSGMTNSYTGTLTMAATSGTNTITSGTKTIANLTINGTGGTFTASDATTVSGTFTMTAGTFNVGNGASALTMTVGTFSQTGGTFNIAGSSATANQVLTVSGNFTLATGGTFDINALAAANYSGRLNVAGNFTHSGTTLKATRSSLTYCLIYLNGTTGTQTLESTGQTGTIAWSVAASNAQCNVAATKSFTLNTAASFVVGGGTSSPDLLIDGTFVNSSAVGFTMTGTGQVSSTGTYQHAVNSGTIPTLTWSTGSLCNVTGITTTVCSGLGQTFYNLTWNCASQTSTVAMNASPTVSNDFTITTTNSAGGGILVLSSSATQTMTVGGNFTMTAGKFYLNTSISTGPVITFTVTGSTSINGGIFYLDNSSMSGPLTVTYTTGDFTLASGTTFDCGVYNTVNVNFKGSVTNTGTGIFRSTSAAPTINFSGTGSTQIYNNSSSGYASANLSVWNIGTGASSPTVVQLGSNLVTEQDAADNSQEIVTVWGTLIFGTGSTNGTNSFYVDVNTGFNGTFATDKFEVKTNGVLKITSTDGIVLSKTLGNVRQYYADASHIVMAAGAFYHYVGTAAQSTGSALPTSISGGLIINNTSGSATGVSLSQATTISGILTLTNGLFTTTSVLIPSITNTLNTAVTGGSTTCFVNGPMKWTLANSGGGAYSFPLGKATITYCPFGLSSVTGTSPVVTAEVFSGNAGGSASASTISSLSTTEYWTTSYTGTYTTGSVSLTRQSALGSLSQIGQSSTLAGTYTGINGTVSGTSINNSDLTGTSLGYFVMGCDASGYYWNGGSIAATPAAGGTGTWSTANSWRQPTSSGAQATWSDANNAFIAGTAGTITLSSSPTATATYLKTTGYTLATTGAARTLAGPLSLGSYNLTLAPTSTSSADLILSGIISGSGLLTHNGTGATTLSGANTNSGGVTLTAGTLRLNHATAIGTGTFTIASGTTLDNTSGGSITNSNNNVQTWNGDFTFTGTNSLNLGTGAVTLGTHTTITAAHATNTLTIGGIIGDGASTFNLATAGTAGAIILSGANTYGGTTTVGAGSKLQLGAAGVIPDASALTVSGTFNMASYSETVGSIAGAGTIDNSTGAGTYTLTCGGDATSTTYSGAIQNTSGTIALTKTGAGTLTLSGASTYIGATTISTGVINVQNATATGTTAGGVTVASGAAIQLQGGITVGAEALTINNTGISSDGALRNISGDNTWGGAITLSTNATRINSDAGTLTLSGATSITATNINLTVGGAGNTTISGATNSITTGSGTLTKDGAGTLTITTAATYTGATTVSAGVLNIQSATGTGTTAGGVTVSSGAALQLQGGITVGAEALSLNNTGISSDGALRNVSGNNTWGGAITLSTNAARINSDAGTLTLNAATSITSTNIGLTVGGAGNTTISGATNSITIGSGTLTKDGAGTLTITTAATYTGATTVSAGVLNIQSATGTGTTAGGVTVSSGAALQLQGGITVGAEALSLNNTGISSDGALRNISGNNTWGGAITLSTNAARINSDAGTLTLNAATSITSTNIGLTVGGAGNTTISGATNSITIGSGTLTKDGAGTLTITTAATYTGATLVSAGVLNIQSATGTGTTAGGVTVSSGAALQLQGAISVGAEALSLAGTGVSTDGALRSISGANSYAGVITLASAARINSDASTLTLTGGITATNIDLSIGGAGNTTISTTGITTGSGALTKDGAGTLTISASGTYTGLTAVSAGILDIQNATATGTVSGGITVASGAAVQLTGGIAVGAEALQLISDGVSSAGALRSISGANSYAGVITLSTTASRINCDASTLTLTGGITATNINLTIGGAGATTVSTTGITTGTGTLTKDGAGSLTLSASSTYTGTTTITAGTLYLGAANIISNSSNFSLGGGTFSTGSGVGYSETVGTLSMTSSSTIALGTGSHSLNFAASTNSAWTGTLTITGWTGNWDGTTGTAGKIYFGSSTAGLNNTSPTIAQIRFYNATTTTYFPATILATGELVPCQNTFYSKSSSTPSTASNWNTSRAGTGTDAVAGDFTAGNIFVVQGSGNGGTSPHTMTTSASWSVSGTNSKIQVENGATLVAANTFPITVAAASTFQVDNGGTYKHQNTSAYATTILQGTTSLGTTSTFETNRTATTLPTLASYGNMIVNYTTDPGATIYSTAITTCNGLTVTAAPTSFALTGANTFTGGVTLTSGTLLLGNASALGSGTFTINGGTINTTGGAVTSSTNNAQTWGGDFTFTGTNNLDLGTGAVTLGATRSVTVSGSILTVGGIISGATYGITKAGAGTLTLSGVNTYTGATTVNAGTLIAKNSASALGAGTLTLGGGTLQLSNTSGANLSFSRNTTVSTSSQITSDVNASGAGNTYTLGTLSIGNQTLTVAGGTNVTSGTAGVTFGSVTHTSTPTYTVNDPAGGGTTQLSLGAVSNSTFLATMNGSGDIIQTGVYGNGSGGITYSGTGSLTLNQANTFTGALTVSSGTVIGTSNAAALGAGTLTLGGGTLKLTNASASNLSFSRNTTVSSSSQITTDVTSSGAGDVFTLGTLSIGNQTLTVAGGTNVTSGTAGVTFGSVTHTSTPTYTVNDPAGGGTTQLSLGAVSNSTFLATMNGSGDIIQTGVYGNGSGGITYSGTGSLTLNQANTFTGALTVSSGTVIGTSNAAALGAGTLTLGGGTLKLTNASASNLSFSRNTTVSSSSQITTDVTSSGAGDVFTLGTLSIGNQTLTVAGGTNVTSGTAGVTFGSVTHTSTPTYTVNNPAGGGTTQLSLGAVSNSTFLATMNGSGDIIQTGVYGNGSGGITYSGTGTLTLNQANTFTGALTVSSGTVIGTSNAAALGAGTLTLSGGTLKLTNASASNLSFSRNTTVSTSSQITTDVTSSGAGDVFTLGTLSIGNQTLTIAGGTNVTSGTAGVTFGAVTHTSTPTYTVNNPAGGGTTQLSLGAVSNSTFLATMNGSGDIIQTGVYGNGSGGITYSGTGTLTLDQVNTFTGAVTLTSGTIIVKTSASALGAGTLALNGGTLRVTTAAGSPLSLNRNTTVGGNVTMTSQLNNSGAGNIHTFGTLSIGNNTLTILGGSNVASGTAGITFGAVTHTSTPTYTITNSGAGGTTQLSLGAVTGSTYLSTFNGDGNVIQTGVWAGSGGLTYSGTGTLTLSQANTYTGVTTISSGTVLLAASGVLADASTMSLGGGTFSSGSTTGYDETLGTLTMTATSTINVGTSNSHAIHYGDSHLAAWTGTLYITNWTGSWDGTTGTKGQIFFGNSASGLSTAQVAQIQFYDGATYYPAMILSTGEIVPTRNFYSKSSGAANLQTLSNWGTATDGTGCAPLNFTSNNQVFYIKNTTSFTIGGAWTVSGTSSKVVLGSTSDAAITFTIPSGSAFTGTIDLPAALSGSNTLTIQNTTIPTFGTINSASTINYNSSSNQTITSTTYGNLSVTASSGTPTKTLGGAITVAGDLTIGSGTTLDVSNGNNYGISLAGNWSESGTFTPRSGTVTFTGSSSAINGSNSSETFYNLTLNKTAGQTLSTGGSITSVTVSNAFTETTGNFTAPATMSITGTTTLTAGTFTAPSGTLTLSGALTNNGGTFTHNSGTVTFTGSTSAINGTAASAAFNNVIITKTAGQTLSTGGSTTSITVAGTFTETTGNFTAPATMSITGATTLTAGTFTAPSGTLTLSGDLTNNGATFTHNSGTVAFTGSSSAINGTAASAAFNNVTITKTAGQTLSTGGSTTAITVAGTFTETTGNFTAPATMSITGTTTLTAGTFTAPSGTLTLSGALTNNGATFTHNSGTVTFTGSSSAINGTAVSQGFNNVLITKTAGQTLSTGGSTTSITVAGTFTETTGNFTAPATMSITGTTTLTAGTFTAPSGTLTFEGDYANNGATFTHNSGTVIMGGSATQTIGGSSSTSFNNLTNSNTSAALSVTVNTNVAGTLNMNGAGTILTPSASVIFNTGAAAGTITGTGTVQVTRTAATADYSSQFKFTTNTLTNLTVEYYAAAAQTVSGLTYGKLKINNAAGATLAGATTVNSTLTLTSGTLTLSGNTLTLADNSAPVRTAGNIDATHASAEIAFTNTSAITLPTSLFTSTVSKFKMNGVGGITLPENTTVTGTLTLTSGLLTVTGGTTLTLGTTSTNVTMSGGSSSSYIVAYDGGTIGTIQRYVNSNTSYVFPMGDATNYTPLTFTLNSNGGLASAYLNVYTKAEKIAGLNSAFTSYLNRYWEFSQSGMTTPNYNLELTYADGDIVGTESTLLPIKKSGTTWYKPTGSSFTTGITQGTGSVDVASNTLTWNTLTTFSSGSGVGPMAVGLPIELIYFKGEKDGNYNELRWETASEKNNDFFTVEKTSKDGSSFDVVGTMNGAGNSNKSITYSLTDYNVEKTINYYRLKQTDFDGKSTFSDLISIDNSEKISKKEIIMITNILGQEVNDNYRGLVIIGYSDGSSEKIIR